MDDALPRSLVGALLPLHARHKDQVASEGHEGEEGEDKEEDPQNALQCDVGISRGRVKHD